MNSTCTSLLRTTIISALMENLQGRTDCDCELTSSTTLRLPRWWAILSTPHPRTTTPGLPGASVAWRDDHPSTKPPPSVLQSKKQWLNGWPCWGKSVLVCYLAMLSPYSILQYLLCIHASRNELILLRC